MRTSIAILAFGFLIEKFSLYLRWVMGAAYQTVGGPPLRNSGRRVYWPRRGTAGGGGGTFQGGTAAD
ncbi:MAG: hypothetical protein ACUVTQ_05615 [Desulfotomaculales bacterium]